jgi:5-methylcytosine-specific restriction enzyme A
MSIDDFEVGRTYNRRRDIHARYGGQMQGGISTPAAYPLIFAFTGSSGRRHGYEDEWASDGTLSYFGEGQEGDMTLTAGNKAIANQLADGKELLLFEALGSGTARYRGPFDCASYSFQPGVDRLGTQRRAIVFHLVPVDAAAIVELAAPPEPDPDDLNLAELRRRALAAAGPARELAGAAARSSYFGRSQAVRQYVLRRAAGKCEGCDAAAPFVTPAGKPYLEPHHIRRLTDQGPDDPRFMAALCPNCHREVHYGERGTALNKSLQEHVSEVERSISDAGD